MKKVSRGQQWVFVMFLAVSLTACGIFDDDDDDYTPTATNYTLEEGVYEITYTPDNGPQYTESFYLKQAGDIITGSLCGNIADQTAAPSLYGYANGNDVILGGVGSGFRNYSNTQSIATTENLFYFWPEYFDFLVPGVTTQLGPPADGENSISFHNSFLGCATGKGYINGCDFSLHFYGGSITVDTLLPNITGSFTSNALYTAHIPPGQPLTGEISGTFNIPFDGSTGTFTATGTVDGMNMAADVNNAFFVPYYRADVTIDNNNLISGVYDRPWDNEQGTLTSTFTAAGNGCP